MVTGELTTLLRIKWPGKGSRESEVRREEGHSLLTASESLRCSFPYSCILQVTKGACHSSMPIQCLSEKSRAHYRVFAYPW